VPGVLKERDRLIGRGDPVLDRYARVTFEKTLIETVWNHACSCISSMAAIAAIDVLRDRAGAPRPDVPASQESQNGHCACARRLEADLAQALR
jgi:hypothetical protein